MRVLSLQAVNPFFNIAKTMHSSTHDFTFLMQQIQFSWFYFSHATNSILSFCCMFTRYLLLCLLQTATERLYNVLLFPDGGWLVDPLPLPHTTPLDQSRDGLVSQSLQHLSPELASREPDRKYQLDKLRKIYIPQVCSLLQSILCSTNQHKVVYLSWLVYL